MEASGVIVALHVSDETKGRKNRSIAPTPAAVRITMTLDNEIGHKMTFPSC